jgi:hypothetical protein
LDAFAEFDLGIDDDEAGKRVPLTTSRSAQAAKEEVDQS